MIPNRLGRGYGPDTGFKVAQDPDTVLAPDAAFVRAERVPPGDLPETYWPGPPGLAVEETSPNDRATDAVAEALEWLDAGTLGVVTLDPRRRLATV